MGWFIQELIAPAGCLTKDITFNSFSLKFLKESQSKNIDDHYAVYKDSSVASKWKTKLDLDIQKEIENDIKGTDLEVFLVE